MRLIQLGNLFINLDHVVSAEYHPFSRGDQKLVGHTTALYIATVDGKEIRLYDKDAEAMNQILIDTSLQIS